MKYLLLLTLLLAGCSTVVPVTQKFPEPPGLLSTQPCPPLQQLNTTPQLSDVAKVVTQNYTQYYECVVKVDTWNEWYLKQKAIFEGLK